MIVFLKIIMYSEVHKGCFIQRYESWKCDLRQLHKYRCRECLLKVFELKEASLFYLRLRKPVLSNDQEKMKSYRKLNYLRIVNMYQNVGLVQSYGYTWLKYHRFHKHFMLICLTTKAVGPFTTFITSL